MFWLAVVYVGWIAVNFDLAKRKKMNLGAVILLSILCTPLIGFLYVVGYRGN